MATVWVLAGHHVRDEVRYRCRYPAEYALANDVDHPRTVLVREDVVVEALDGWLAELFDPEYRVDMITTMLNAAGPDDTDAAIIEAARRQLTDCDNRLGRYRSALEHGADPAVVAVWIAEVKGERLAAERMLATARSEASLTAEEFALHLDDLGDLRTALAVADPALKAETYRDVLGLSIIYRPAINAVKVSASPLSKGRIGGPMNRILTGV
jgi:site-specific DNA recombinase